ncbi:calcyclin-binding protein-like [Corticium candelabrum]|uniref:calcyclin-binding protein-like n=1 Tax=Corticium candelabrum TaxID=121492 RepID=UPI002E2618C9|nr:calcyclin-binding protein-like [Corticium candelabrum]
MATGTRTSKLEGLRLDAAELAHLLSLVTRDRVKVGLMREQEQIKTEIQAEEGLLNCTASVTAIRNPRRNDDERANRPRIHTSKITTYGWDESDTAVKIYITLAGVEKLPQENISVNFGNKSFDFHVRELDGKNYQLHILNLSGAIVPAESQFTVRHGKVTILLKKADKGKWDNLVPSKKKETTPKLDKDADPSQSIMNMMKQMYQDGDDEMKRTIAKAWTESREKKDQMNV